MHRRLAQCDAHYHFVLPSALLEAFKKAAEAADTTPSEMLRELMRWQVENNS